MVAQMLPLKREETRDGLDFPFGENVCGRTIDLVSRKREAK
jgi:hypothetical protein